MVLVLTGIPDMFPCAEEANGANISKNMIEANLV
jgi:hypothetical protein